MFVAVVVIKYVGSYPPIVHCEILQKKVANNQSPHIYCSFLRFYQLRKGAQNHDDEFRNGSESRTTPTTTTPRIFLFFPLLLLRIAQTTTTTTPTSKKIPKFFVVLMVVIDNEEEERSETWNRKILAKYLHLLFPLREEE